MDNCNYSEKGQSTIEFIFSFVFGLSLVLVIFNTSINYATGYLVHYATFMASRVYLTADNHTGTIGDSNPSLGQAVSRATAAFNNYNLSVLKVPNENFRINEVQSVSGSNENMTVGARTTFELTMDVLGRITGQKKLEMVSESFLGKEPTRAECASRTCMAVTGQTTCEDTMDVTLFDDGC
jgi:hypothetical protein